MFTDRIDNTVVSIDFSGFRQQDTNLFNRYCELWFKMANSPLAVGHAPQEHLLSTLEHNHVALDEYSETISDKWMTVLGQNAIWKALLTQSPFKFSIQKVVQNRLPRKAIQATDQKKKNILVFLHSIIL